MQIFYSMGWFGGARVSTLTPMLFKDQLCLLNHVKMLGHRLSLPSLSFTLSHMLCPLLESFPGRE